MNFNYSTQNTAPKRKKLVRRRNITTSNTEDNIRDTTNKSVMSNVPTKRGRVKLVRRSRSTQKSSINNLQNSDNNLQEKSIKFFNKDTNASTYNIKYTTTNRVHDRNRPSASTPLHSKVRTRTIFETKPNMFSLIGVSEKYVDKAIFMGMGCSSTLTFKKYKHIRKSNMNRYDYLAIYNHNQDFLIDALTYPDTNKKVIYDQAKMLEDWLLVLLDIEFETFISCYCKKEIKNIL